MAVGCEGRVWLGREKVQGYAECCGRNRSVGGGVRRGTRTQGKGGAGHECARQG